MASIDDVLGEDHETLGRLLKQLMDVVPKDASSALSLLERFSRGLRHHMTWEEQDLFPAVRDHATETEKRSIESLEIDHERIRETLSGLKEALESGDGARASERVGLVDTYLKGHNYDEEHGVYEEADRYLSAEERSRLIEKFQAGRRNAEA